MIQDIFPKNLNNTFCTYMPREKDFVLSFCFAGILVKAGEVLEFPTIEEYKKKTGKESFVYLFSIENNRFFMAGEEVEITVEGYIFQKIQKIRQYKKKEWIFVAATGWHLYNWYCNNRFCGRCGKTTVPDKKERMLRCECGNMIFPKIAPAVIVAVENGDSLLLTRYANRAYKKYALIAGFTEIGETAEETVQREVMEEAGLKVKNIRYYKSQPWGFDSNLLLGFFCELDGDANITRDEEELSEALWVKRDEIPDYNEGLSLTEEMMQFFKNSK